MVEGIWKTWLKVWCVWRTPQKALEKTQIFSSHVGVLWMPKWFFVTGDWSKISVFWKILLALQRTSGFLDFRSSWILRDQTCFNPKTFATSSPCFLFGHINFYKALTSAVKRNTHLCLPSVGFGQWSKNHLDMVGHLQEHTYKDDFTSWTVDIPKCQTYHPVTNRIILHCRLYLEILLATLNPYISTKQPKPLVGFFRLSGRKDLPRYPRSRHAWSSPSNVPGQASGSHGFVTSCRFHKKCKQHGINRSWKIQFLNISMGIRRFVDVGCTVCGVVVFCSRSEAEGLRTLL